MNPYASHADQWFETGATAGGSFLKRLYDLCAVADTSNLQKLVIAYPAEVGAWIERQKGITSGLSNEDEVERMRRLRRATR